MDTSRASAPDVDRAQLLQSAARLREVLRHGVYFLRSMEGSRQITSQQISLLTMLRPGGVLVMEHADSQGATLPQALRATGAWAEVEDRVDLSGRPRATVAVRVAGLPGAR